MDRRSILAIVLSLALLQGYWYLYAPPEEPVVPPVDTPAAVVPAPAPGGAAVPTTASAPVRSVPLRWCDVEAAVSTDGAALRSVQLTAYRADFRALPAWKWGWQRLTGATSDAWTPYHTDGGPAQLLTGDSQLLAAGAGVPGAALPRFEVVQEDAAKIVLHAVTPEGIDIQRTYAVGADCLVDVETTWKNVGSGAFNGPVWLASHDHMVTDGSVANVLRPVGMIEGSVSRWTSVDDLLDEPYPYEGPVQWFGLHDHYFAALVVGGGLDAARLTFDAYQVGDEPVYGAHWQLGQTLNPGQSVTAQQKLYVGPKQLERLRAVQEDLGDAIDLGYMGFFVSPLLWALKRSYDLVQNWGLAIVALTFLLKMLLYPLTAMSFRSGQAMQDIQPLLAGIREKYADNPEELNRQTMAIFSEHGVNPAGGCLPMLAQMPIWISLYTMLGSSVEIYQSEFLYLKDLSSADPIGVLPLAVVVLMYVQQKMTPMGNLDPAQQQVMQLMPLIFGVITFSVPSGLVVYMFVNMVLSMLQQWWMKRSYTKKKTA